MAELKDRIDINVEELEMRLGAKKLPEFIKECEQGFIDRIDSIVESICSDFTKRAVFVSGPTSSGKTTFTMRLSDGLKKHGKEASFLSLDDYYIATALKFDKDGRPDFETIDSLDIERAARDVRDIIDGKKVIPPFFNFITRQSEELGEDSAIQLPDNGVLVVEGLHGLSEKFAGSVDSSMCIKVFIMPYGNVYCDTKLMDSQEIRLLRRIVRDNRHRGANALATIDYWPMIERSEETLLDDYLPRADFHLNSYLPYETLIIAPMALNDIKAALKAVEDGTIEPNAFMERSNKKKDFADLSTALSRCNKLISHLEMIPVVDPNHVPSASILNEFIT
ncbi:MAG: hypothetical protein MJ108_06080 [Saccharofermentans sp.]|nr:hypothetical protein [Saccharofermentans sp.]